MALLKLRHRSLVRFRKFERLGAMPVMDRLLFLPVALTELELQLTLSLSVALFKLALELPSVSGVAIIKFVHLSRMSLLLCRLQHLELPN
mmetsp:Transcript_68565/g.190849  ORF Transcript_68565/g.190849 Transcript_68565/m.190849 type:complete len:90 (-) Transcript_68565:1766-2035(-)